MNKKAQAGIIGFIFLLIAFIIVIAVLGGQLWPLWSNASTTAGLTGIAAFVYDNPAFLMFIGLVLGILGWFYFGQ